MYIDDNSSGDNFYLLRSCYLARYITPNPHPAFLSLYLKYTSSECQSTSIGFRRNSNRVSTTMVVERHGSMKGAEVENTKHANRKRKPL